MTYITRRNVLRNIGVVALTPALPGILSAGQSSPSLTALRGDENDFFRAPVLLTGEKEAILLDGSFNYPAGQA